MSSRSISLQVIVLGNESVLVDAPVEAIDKNMSASYDNRRKEINRRSVAFDGGVIFS